MKRKEITNSQHNLKKKKKNGAGGIRLYCRLTSDLTDFRSHYKATVITTVWYWHKNKAYRSMTQDRKPRDKPTHIWPSNL